MPIFQTRPPFSLIADMAEGRAARLIGLMRADASEQPSDPAAPAFGLHSAVAAERQLLFSAGPYDIDLRLTPAGDCWAVSGQLLGDDNPGAASVEMLGHADTAKAVLGAQGEFTLHPLRPGSYTLTVSLARQRIVVPDVQLGP